VPIMTVWNGIASGGNNVSCRRLSAEIDPVGAHAVASPVLRLFRMSTQAVTPGGTVITPERQYLADPVMNSLVSIRMGHGVDGAAPTTALATGTLSAQPMWSQTFPRMNVSSGFWTPTEFNMMPNDSSLNSVDPLILRPQEGFAVVAFFPVATSATAAIWSVMMKAVLAEFIYP